MDQSPWETNRLSASQVIPYILQNPNVHHSIHKCPPSIPILRQFEPVPNPTSHFLKIHPNIILPSSSGSPKWSLSLRFHHKNPVYDSPLPHTLYILRLSHSSRNAIEVIMHDWSHIIRCQYYMHTAHLLAFTVSSALHICTVNKQPNSKSQSVITALPSFNG